MARQKKSSKTNNSKPRKEHNNDRGGNKYSERMPGGNDLSWYTKNAALVENAARFPFVKVPGSTIDLGRFMPYINTTSRFQYTVPGVMGLGFYPSVGRSTKISDPINVAAREVYSKIRSKYSGSLEADAPDIMMYILALDSLYMMYEHVKRGYYLTNQFSSYSKLFPDSIFDAMHMNRDSYASDMMKVYTRLVEFGAQLAKFPVPDEFPIFKRHSFLCANVYGDANDPKAQMYVMYPRGFYYLDGIESKTTLKIHKFSQEECEDVNVMLDTMFEALDRLVDWDTSYTILGYFLRAYEGMSYVVPSPIVQDAILQPVWNEQFLLQIRNMSICSIREDSLKVEQDPTKQNMLISLPRIRGAGGNIRAVISDVVPVNLPMTNPTPADIIEATRASFAFAPGSYEEGADKDTYEIICGTEVFDIMGVYLDHDQDTEYGTVREYEWFGTVTNFYINFDGTYGTIISDFHELLEIVSQISTFNYHPIIRLRFETNDDGSIQRKDVLLTDVQNLAPVENTELADLHRYCLYSQFNCFGN